MEDAPSRPNPQPPAPDTFGDTLATLFSGYGGLFGPLLIVAVLLGVLNAVTDVLQLEGMARMQAQESPGVLFVLASLATWLGSSYFWTVALLRADSVYRDGRVGGEFTRAWRLVLPVAVYLLLYLLLTLIGTVLLLLPGLFLSVLLVPGVMLIVLRDAGILRALKDAAVLVWGSWWFSFGVLLVVFLVAAIPMLAAEALAAGLRQSPNAAEQVTAALLTSGALVVVLPLTTSMFYVLLHALEARRTNAAMERRILKERS